MNTKPLLGAAVGIAGAGLALNAINTLTGPQKVRRMSNSKARPLNLIKPVSTKRIVKAGVTLAVGAALLGAATSLID